MTAKMDKPASQPADAGQESLGTPAPGTQAEPTPAKVKEVALQVALAGDESIQFQPAEPISAQAEIGHPDAISGEAEPPVAAATAADEIKLTPEEGKRILAEWEAEQARVPKMRTETRGTDKVLIYLEGDYKNQEFIYTDGSKFLSFGLDKDAPP